jgi:hypothetical protein
MSGLRSSASGGRGRFVGGVLEGHSLRRSDGPWPIHSGNHAAIKMRYRMIVGLLRIVSAHFGCVIIGLFLALSRSYTVDTAIQRCNEGVLFSATAAGAAESSTYPPCLSTITLPSVLAAALR